MNSLLTQYRRAATLVVALAAIACAGCDNSISNDEELPPLWPASADTDAGTWQMIELTSPTQINVAAPLPTTDPAYLQEIEAAKTAQAQISDGQLENIHYWSGGGVLRWNQIMREFVARANLPPAPRPDGTYPVPDPNNPFSEPQFPFGNPPYAARAYSYVAVAQYEALKVAWYYKQLYNRPPPFRVDSNIKPLMPYTTLAAYPSEDAVVSSVTAELLKVLFPTSVEEISQNAERQRQAAFISGKASASDIEAGVALGQAVAAAFLNRARNDGMRTAGGSPAQWASLADAAIARGEIPWRSMDSPARPPMLPLFGQVRAWMMTANDVTSGRPPPPPSTSSPQMAAELAEVRNTTANLTRDQLAIVHKWADGVSTPTPPGHWNAIAVPYISAARFSDVRAARALALLNMAMHDAAVVCWGAKYAYFNPRPSQLDPAIKTFTGIPNFPAYTSGHSTFSAAAADVLSYLFPESRVYFQNEMNEASISRLYGGIHYRSDIEVGKTQGGNVARFTTNFAAGDGAQ